MSIKLKSSLLAGTSIVLILSIFAGCSLLETPADSLSPSATPSPMVESASPTPEPTPTVTKADIQKSLDAQAKRSSTLHGRPMIQWLPT